MENSTLPKSLSRVEDVIFSSRNPSKIMQVKDMFTGSLFNVLSLEACNIAGEAVEDGETLEDNAYKKAAYAYEHKRFVAFTMADDTGLKLKALNDRPGIYSARWAGEKASTQDIIEHTLKEMHGKKDRTAIFETCVALISPEGETSFHYGSIQGVLLEEPRCQPLPSMPYSCLFLPDGHKKTFAEMTVEEKNLISHRATAFRQARDYMYETNY